MFKPTLVKCVIFGFFFETFLPSSIKGPETVIQLGLSS